MIQWSLGFDPQCDRCSNPLFWGEEGGLAARPAGRRAEEGDRVGPEERRGAAPVVPNLMRVRLDPTMAPTCLSVEHITPEKARLDPRD